MKYLLLILACIFSVNSFSQLKKADKFAKTITAEELKEHLYIYASDEFEGRNTGAKGQKKAVEYLRKFYIENEIEPGDPDKDYFQKMKLNLRRGNEGEVDSENVIAIIKGSEKPEKGWPVPFDDSPITPTTFGDPLGYIEKHTFYYRVARNGYNYQTQFQLVEALDIDDRWAVVKFDDAYLQDESITGCPQYYIPI